MGHDMPWAAACPSCRTILPSFHGPHRLQAYGRKAMRNAYDAISTAAEEAPGLISQPANAQVCRCHEWLACHRCHDGPALLCVSFALMRSTPLDEHMHSYTHAARSAPDLPYSDHPAAAFPQAGHAARRRPRPAAAHGVPHRGWVLRWTLWAGRWESGGAAAADGALTAGV